MIRIISPRLYLAISILETVWCINQKVKFIGNKIGQSPSLGEHQDTIQHNFSSHSCTKPDISVANSRKNRLLQTLTKLSICDNM